MTTELLRRLATVLRETYREEGPHEMNQLDWAKAIERTAELTESDEVAESLRDYIPRNASLYDCRLVVRAYMPGESEVVIDNVAESLWRSR